MNFRVQDNKGNFLQGCVAVLVPSRVRERYLELRGGSSNTIWHPHEYEFTTFETKKAVVRHSHKYSHDTFTALTISLTLISSKPRGQYRGTFTSTYTFMHGALTALILSGTLTSTRAAPRRGSSNTTWHPPKYECMTVAVISKPAAIGTSNMMEKRQEFLDTRAQSFSFDPPFGTLTSMRGSPRGGI